MNGFAFVRDLRVFPVRDRVLSRRIGGPQRPRPVVDIPRSVKVLRIMANIAGSLCSKILQSPGADFLTGCRAA